MFEYLVQVGSATLPFVSPQLKEIGDVLILPTFHGLIPMKIIRLDYNRLLDRTVLVSKPFDTVIEYDIYTGAILN